MQNPSKRGRPIIGGDIDASGFAAIAAIWMRFASAGDPMWPTLASVLHALIPDFFLHAWIPDSGSSTDRTSKAEALRKRVEAAIDKYDLDVIIKRANEISNGAEALFEVPIPDSLKNLTAPAYRKLNTPQKHI